MADKLSGETGVALDKGEGVGATYDALGRMVEQDFSGSYRQIVYSPTGVKSAITTGQSLSYGFVGLPGGLVAEYWGTGAQYYRHPDWLGNTRLASSSARAIHYDTAYSPFGSTYASTGTAD